MKLLLSVIASTDDIVQLEPTIEALYYKYENCELTLRVNSGYEPFFEHHPLIHAVIDYEDSYDLDIEASFDVHTEIPDIQAWTLKMPLVEKFAAAAEVTLIRKTPKIFLEEYPVDGNFIVLANVPHNVTEWDDSLTALHSSAATVKISTAANADALRGHLQLLAAALVVVGPDSWATHAAAALDCNVVMAVDLSKEIERAPFNVVLVSGTKESVLQAVNETLAEKRYPDYLNRGNAAEFVKCLAKRYMRSNFVDIGCSAWPIPNGIPVDIGNREVIEQAPEGHYAGVFSSHCLEHIVEWEPEVTLWHHVLRQGGPMVLYLPHPRAEVWHAHTGSWVGSEHVWNPEPVTLVRFLKEVLGMNIIEYTSRRDPLWSFHIVARKV